MSKTHVYANNLEIACKASDGKSPCSFPDPCFSPPAPPAGWPVIPYANTAHTKHATKTSKTVFIGNKPVILKDKSYIKKSTGNEPATGPKGLITHTKKGKAYFRSWSMDVKIEGQNVCRHGDLITHNHNPTSGNAGIWHFVSDKASKTACADDIKKVNEACASHEGETVPVSGAEDSKKRPKTWKDDHCKDMIFKPPNNTMKTINTKIKYMKKIIGKLKTEKIDLSNLTDELLTLESAISTGNAEQKEEALKKFKDGYISNMEKKSNEDGSCLRARKCMLTPYNKTEKKHDEKEESLKLRMGNPDGCCPGQTGHHLIPDSWAKSAKCKDYTHGDAPVVCVEGITQRHGSHGRIHDALNNELNKMKILVNSIKILKKTLPDIIKRKPPNIKSRENVIEMAANSHEATFEDAKCNKECIKSQLRNYYKSCGKFSPKRI
ncbi:MAG: PAAR-like domain-containing protein [Pseudomonadota bacterium]